MAQRGYLGRMDAAASRQDAGLFTGDDRLSATALVSLFVFAAGVLFGEHFLRDPDVYWHIKSGLDIWSSGVFPTTDPYSHSWADEPWIAKEWGSQLILAAAYSLGGWNGVVLASALAVATIGGLLFWLLSTHIRGPHAALIVVACLCLSALTLLARPHIFALPLIILFTHGVWTAAQETKAPPFWLLGVMCLWANLHGSFTIGFVIAAIAAAQFLMGGGRGQSALVNKWALFLGLLPLAAMIHPYGYESIWSTVVQLENDSSQYIREWTPFSVKEFPTHGLAILALVGAALVSGVRLPTITAFFLIFLLYLFFSHARFAMFFFLLGPLVVLRDLARQFPGVARKGEAGFFAAPLFRNDIIIAVCGIAAIGASIIALLIQDYPPRREFNPAAALAAAREYGVTGNVLNAYNFGGALILEGVPTFIDGRADRLYNGFIPEIKATQEIDGARLLREQIHEFSIGWAILPPDDARVRHFRSFENWRQIHEDDVSVVFIKEED